MTNTYVALFNNVASADSYHLKSDLQIQILSFHPIIIKTLKLYTT